MAPAHLGRAIIIGLVLLGLVAGCDDGAGVEGLVRDINSDVPIAAVAVGFLQVQADQLVARGDFTATTDGAGVWAMQTQSGPFPEGFLTFNQEFYVSDTVHFFGSNVGKTERVELFMVPLNESAAVPPPTVIR